LQISCDSTGGGFIIDGMQRSGKKRRKDNASRGLRGPFKFIQTVADADGYFSSFFVANDF
jgi:hypothetical protein